MNLPRQSLFLRLCLLSLLSTTLLLSACKGGDGAGEEGSKDEAKAEDGKDGKQDKDKVESVPVEIAVATRRPISASYTGTANLEAPGEAQVVAKTSGVVLQMLAEEGDAVRAGQVLARIDPEKTRLEVQRQQATVNKLANNYRRSQELLAQKLVSTEASDQIRYDLESARASLELTKLELSYTNITAPISGVIAQRMVKPGNLVGLNAPVFRIVDNSRLEAVLNVPERELGKLRVGMPVRMGVDALTGRSFEGSIDRLSPVVDAGSGTFRVVCTFKGGENLSPGMFGRIAIIYDQRDNALTVPRTALLEGEGETAVYVVRENKAVRVPVQVGFINGEIAEIVSGLREGERTITAGKVAVRDGTLVEVIQPQAAVATATAKAVPAKKADAEAQDAN